MRIWASLRALALLRRLVKASEAANVLARERLALDHPEWGKVQGFHKPAKLVEIGTASVEDWNERWRREHEGLEG